MPNPEGPSLKDIFKQIKDEIFGFPQYLAKYILGFHVILTHIEMTTMAIVGILVGKLTRPLWGLVGALTLWLQLVTLSNIGDAIAKALGSLAQANHRQAAAREALIRQDVNPGGPQGL